MTIEESYIGGLELLKLLIIIDLKSPAFDYSVRQANPAVYVPTSFQMIEVCS